MSALFGNELQSWFSGDSWSFCFALTCAFEYPVYYLFLRRELRGARVMVGVVLGLNLLTHPALWAFLAARPWRTEIVLLGELAAVLVEGSALCLLLVAWRIERRRALRLAFLSAGLANALSFLAGLALMPF